MLTSLFFNGIALGAIDTSEYKKATTSNAIHFKLGNTFDLINDLILLITVGNITVLRIWKQDCQIFMIMLHFAYGLGGIMGPLITTPFLLTNQGTNNSMTSSKDSFNITTNDAQSLTDSLLELDNVRIHYAFWIVSFTMVCVSFLFLYIYVLFSDTVENPAKITSDDKMQESTERQPINKLVYTLVVFLSILFFNVFFGLDVAMSSYMTTYGVHSDLHLSKVTGARITSVYWSFFTFYRLVAILYIDRVGAEKNLIFEMVLILLANCFLVPFGNTHEWALWVGAALMGIGSSTVWASMYGFLEQFFPVTNIIIASFSVSACVGEFLFPNLIGFFIFQVVS